MSPDTPDIPDNVKAAVEAQGQLIAGRLRREAGFSFGNRNMPAQIMWLVSLVTGELVAGLVIDGVTYTRQTGRWSASASSTTGPRTRRCCLVVSGVSGWRSHRRRADRQALTARAVPDPLAQPKSD